MADNYETMNQESPNYGCFKEAVCIDASRVYDSCGEQDCSLYKQPSHRKRKGGLKLCVFLHFARVRQWNTMKTKR